jgi:hypothetical protein
MTDAASWSERQAAAATAWDITPDEFVVAACRRLRPGTALELGAREGSNSLWLAGRGWRVTAVEPALVSVGRLQGRSALLNHPVDAIAADAVAYRPNPDTFDLILLSYLDLPEGQLRRLLSNSVPGLAAGGMVLVVGHDLSNLDGGWGGTRDPDLLTTPDRLADLLGGLGLKVRRAEVVRREVPGEVGVHTILDHVVEAIRPAA